MAGGFDLGALIPGGQEPAQQSNLGARIPSEPQAGGGTWTDLLKNIDPNFLKSAGAQLMVGSPGGLANQFGPAVAKGFEGENLSEQANHERAVQQQAVGLKEAEGEASRKSHEKIAQLGADNRMDVAELKVQGMLDRSRLIHGPQNNQEVKVIADAMNKFMTDPDNSTLLSRKTTEQKQELAKAYALSVLDTARQATGVRSQGAPLSSEGVSSAPPASAGQAPAATIPPQKAGATPQGTPTKPSWDQIKTNSQVQKLLQTEAGRKAIVKERPDLAPFVDRDSPERNHPVTPGM